MDADLVADRFCLGRPLAVPAIVAAGWGERNRVWRLETTAGVFAVKDAVEELLPAHPAEAFRIESVAHASGIASAEPIPTANGSPYQSLEGRWYRCHRWRHGASKDNEHTTADEARQMGVLVAQLHGLRIPVVAPPDTSGHGRSHWLELARRRRDSEWAAVILDQIDRITAAERLAAVGADGDHVGSHCDLNAHNVLFTDEGLVLIDWDGAGPLSVTYERASTASLWAQRTDGRLDIDIAAAFLRGYRDAGGTVEASDPAALPRWLVGLSWWTERNIEIALAHPSTHHDQLAAGLVAALAAGVDTVQTRQRFLTDVIDRL